MRVVGIIPARMSSTRFPGKPMVEIAGLPMIAHCYYRSKLCKKLDEVIVATCDEEIYNYIINIGGKAIMTKNTHERASERAAEAIIKMEAAGIQNIEIVAMIQGDEPLLNPKSIDSMIEALDSLGEDVPIANLIEQISETEDPENPNTVKVVKDKNMMALYMSREAIPSKKKSKQKFKWFKQLGIIAFRKNMLLEFNKLGPMPLEEIESVDMNRVLEHGYKIKLIDTGDFTAAVDTPEDLAIVSDLMKSDPYAPSYQNQ